jgi:hypothetical protein
MTGDRLDRLLEEIRLEFPSFRLVKKHESALHRLIHRALVIVTFGQMRAYLDGYQTTIRRSIYVTSDWDELPRDDRYVTLRHERVHLRQFRRFTTPVMGLLYLLVPLPMGLSYFRAHFERQAYAESIRAAAEVYGRGHVERDAYRDHIIGQFTGPSYGWMWPFRRNLESWYDSVLASLGDAQNVG